MKTSGKDQEQLFNNPWIEKLTRTHIAVPLIIFYGAALIILGNVIFLERIPLRTTLGIFISGVFGFTLLEYMVHRFVFHLPETTEFRKKLVRKIHGIHHEYPRDKSRLAMPPVVSVMLAVILLSLFKFFAGTTGFVFGAGVLTGYASYLTIHYSVHAFTPPKNFANYLWFHHSIHHYKDPNSAYGVSSPLWDVVFGTLPSKE
jgi:sterol desaturase/sphingolipid hydroxylase (fatty acid hydroxylase superfamily)